MSITTKHGDRGMTKLLSGETVSKADLRIELVGTLDELVAALGLARSMSPTPTFSSEIRALQLDLINIGAEFSYLGSQEISKTRMNTVQLEENIATLESEMKLPPSFLIPGTTPCSSALELARTIARRLERLSIAIHEKKGYIGDAIIVYLNRLSDYLFLLARKAEHIAGVSFDRAL
jgi:cob(I)alamin adenosyltransferase